LDQEEIDPTEMLNDDEDDDDGDDDANGFSSDKIGRNGIVVRDEEDLEDELETAYMRYVTGRKKSAKERAADGAGFEENPVTAKRARTANSSNSILSSKNAEDAASLRRRDNAAAVHGDLQESVKMLSGKEKKGSDDDSSSDDDGSEDEYYYGDAGSDNESEEEKLQTFLSSMLDRPCCQGNTDELLPKG
jgi:hypothetical protein